MGGKLSPFALKSHDYDDVPFLSSANGNQLKTKDKSYLSILEQGYSISMGS